MGTTVYVLIALCLVQFVLTAPYYAEEENVTLVSKQEDVVPEVKTESVQTAEEQTKDHEVDETGEEHEEHDEHDDHDGHCHHDYDWHGSESHEEDGITIGSEPSQNVKVAGSK
ncbi:uncharacterized protein LOC129779698 [Toxorhynchites rutilus septentrionalis]|uniref:uncharacterized protein LOC129779698 n=1 Tax=Toxorhynchites rutilus septentrionalis TaxID=329112 RepID=UPI00247A5C61|nr:uncharacterized protein LOC129779698 [Toxorhynchites rutilus septentrionalis]